MADSLAAVRAAAAFETATLQNGLTVRVHPMPDFTGVYALYGARFGSLDRTFLLDGRRIETPAGVAHFLEHKMFENEEGDAFTLFARTGAVSNAFTSFTRTCYLFSATDSIAENLDILLSFVARPYFTPETVEKEQGIIGQEIRQYDDSPEWQMLFGLYRGMYHTHPIRDDIAGSAETIAQITPQLLYDCVEAFYRPQNMVLCVAGNVTMDEVLAACARAKMPEPHGVVERIPLTDAPGIAAPWREMTMSVAKPMVGVGFKEDPAAVETLRAEMLAELIPEIICGSMTPLYRRLYDEGLITAGFSGEASILPGMFAFFFGGETPEPEKVRQLLLEEIARIRREGVDAELFTLCRNQMYGECVQDLENIEDVAGAMASTFFKDRTPADEIEALMSLTHEDADAALRDWLCEERTATLIIRPAGEI